MNTVYALSDPLTSEIRYVGITENLNARIKQHRWSPASKGMAAWVAELVSKGLEPKLSVLESGIAREHASDAERKWMETVRQQGANLLNVRAEGKLPKYGMGDKKFLQLKSIPPDLHLAIKLKAIAQGVTMQEFILDVLAKAVK